MVREKLLLTERHVSTDPNPGSTYVILFNHILGLTLNDWVILLFHSISLYSPFPVSSLSLRLSFSIFLCPNLLYSSLFFILLPILHTFSSIFSLRISCNINNRCGCCSEQGFILASHSTTLCDLIINTFSNPLIGSTGYYTCIMYCITENITRNDALLQYFNCYTNLRIVDYIPE